MADRIHQRDSHAMSDALHHRLRRRRILCVDDDADFLTVLQLALKSPTLETVQVRSAEEALERLRREPVDVIITDIQMPGRSGYEFIQQARAQGCGAPVLVLTAIGSVDGAVRALQLGASDYLLKPTDPERLRRAVQEALRDPGSGAAAVAAGRSGVFHGMLGEAAPMRSLYERIERVGRTSASVLVQGESGTGKELVARALHACSARASGPFVPVHTGAIPRELVASELFGHERGAFTGAVTAAEGKFDAASRGTLFLDEVASMEISVQVALLRVLESLRFTRVGGARERDADVRIVAATNRDLDAMVRQGAFREDLYYRLNVVTVTAPPLRERGADVLLLARHFLERFARHHGTWARAFSAASERRIAAHRWPGNVRELRNAMERTAVFARGEVVEDDELQLDDHRPEGDAETAAIAAPTPPTLRRSGDEFVEIPVGTSLAEAERILIARTLARCDGNKQKAAQVLGISRRGLCNKLRAYHGDGGDDDGGVQ
jgi:DNA-binding NtrC family response regulator